jgi:hypothetical protein
MFRVCIIVRKEKGERLVRYGRKDGELVEVRGDTRTPETGLT